MGLNIESDSEERALARVSKDGHKRDRASGHPSRRRFAPPQDEVCGFKLYPPDPILISHPPQDCDRGEKLDAELLDDVGEIARIESHNGLVQLLEYRLLCDLSLDNL
jgi:hypothetical protein